VPLPGIPSWLDQDIVLYHGTTDLHVANILQAVDETRGSPQKDFGRGFYTTTKESQALDWAIKKAYFGGKAAVIRFTVERNALADLETLFFVRGEPSAADFWSFVQYC
jgi:methenyltetrahydromethanopterin cyclohydrolase